MSYAFESSTTYAHTWLATPSTTHHVWDFEHGYLGPVKTMKGLTGQKYNQSDLRAVGSITRSLTLGECLSQRNGPKKWLSHEGRVYCTTLKINERFGAPEGAGTIACLP
jgi:hypothetical protein